MTVHSATYTNNHNHDPFLVATNVAITGLDGTCSRTLCAMLQMLAALMVSAFAAAAAAAPAAAAGCWLLR